LIAYNSKFQMRELLLLEDHHTIDKYNREVLYRGKLHQGEILHINKSEVVITKVLNGGVAIINSKTPILSLAEKAGSVPLPPYMHRDATKQDIERYQTIFAKQPGSVAAPTASLNFTQNLEQKLHDKGVRIVYLTLHVGLGTFLPIRSDELESHNMHSEYFEIPKSTIQTIQKAKIKGSKIIAIGTTVARTLEFAHSQILHQEPSNTSGEADIFIYPGYKFKVVDALLTNFHAPKSTVLMLTAAFAGWDNLNHAYSEAIEEKYAFLSYGDSMLIL
jgi:S-adenosylmethionine:tRNA ribosyltransferase-isomerase